MSQFPAVTQAMEWYINIQASTRNTVNQFSQKILSNGFYFIFFYFYSHFGLQPTVIQSSITLEEKTGTRKWPGIDQLMRKGLAFSKISPRHEPKSVKSLSRGRVLINLSKNAVSKLHFIAALKAWVTFMTGDNSHAWLQTDRLPSVFKELNLDNHVCHERGLLLRLQGSR